MNAKLLVDSLTLDEKRATLAILRDWENQQNQYEARNFVLDPLYMTMVKEGKKIEAIRGFKESRKISLAVAKIVIDRYAESLKK